MSRLQSKMWLQNKIKRFSHILLCNLLTTILRPNFEEPLDTAKQLVEKNITLYNVPGTEIWKQFLLESSITEYNILGEIYKVANDWEEYDYITEHDLIGAGTHAQMASIITPEEMELGKNKEINSGRGWYRSKEKVAGKYPYGGYLTNKKWHLNEVITKSEYTDTYHNQCNLRKWQDIYYISNK